MRIECAWCRRDLGEKCPNCGSENLIYAESDHKHVECTKCHEIFALGEGGITSTICGDCRPALVVNLRHRLTESEIVDRATRRGSR
ncbi:MAG TPA: hypothetical protein VKP61_15155 [Candidatus Acidoferrum sp.]|nr:hypothetical protein [Candidatus Acidoferrum sp.]